MNKETIKIVIGFDQREAVCYHTFCQSVLEKASQPLQFIPLAENTLTSYKETHGDGSNKFIYTRFLTPYLNDYKGWAIYADGDMICQADLAELWSLRDSSKAVQVVKHNYLTISHNKYLGNKNENYPRKNWSSLILWNCEHTVHQILTPELIGEKTGSYLHRFSWIPDDLIGDLPMEWNWLASEYADNQAAKLIHYTLGAPCFEDYKYSSMSNYWHNTHLRMLEGLNQKI